MGNFNKKQKEWLEKIPSREILDDILRIKYKNKEIKMAQMVKIYQVWHELSEENEIIKKINEVGI